MKYIDVTLRDGGHQQRLLIGKKNSYNNILNNPNVHHWRS